MNNDIRLDLNKTQQYKNIRLEYLTPSTEIYIYKSYRFRKSGARCALNVNLLSSGFPLYNTVVHQKSKIVGNDPPITNKKRPTWFIFFRLSFKILDFKSLQFRVPAVEAPS